MFIETPWKYKKPVTVLLQILPIITLVNQTFKHHNDDDFLWQIVPSTICFILSLILYYNSFEAINLISKQIIKIGVKLGSISYGIYVIHFPILIIFSKIPILTGTLLTYITRAVCFLSITVFAGFFLEIIIQSRIKTAFQKQNTNAYFYKFQCRLKQLFVTVIFNKNIRKLVIIN